jgi:nucleotide-binding universal stress UspA family protein
VFKYSPDFTIKKILVAVDGSESSLGAAQKAIHIAEIYGATLIVLHFISSNIRYQYDGDDVNPQYTGEFKEIVGNAMDQGQNYVDKVKEISAGKVAKVQTEVIVAVKSIVKEIVEYAEKQNIDLIVMGTRGLSGIKKVLLGSTASGVVTHSHCPVLIVK